ncbi:MAG: homocysteine S-methyltransferase family protein, partial [Clostridia bacterium]|nr:homocysteine S-methyltransferase family protein [Clostridia bacterium]
HMPTNHKKEFPFSLPFILDGATGTELTRRGMKEGDCTERFISDNPSILTGLQQEYRLAGSDGCLAPTFGANLPTLLRHGYSADEADAICASLFSLSKSSAEGSMKIGGDMSPTGLLLKPYGDTDPDEVYNIYQKQARVLLDCGADFFFIETMISAAEAYQAVRAVRDLDSSIPIFVSLTVNENGRTMNGDSAAAALVTMSKFRIDGFGCNCSIGPDVILNALTPAAPIACLLGIVLIAKPNAGMPVTDENGTHFPLSPEDMASYADRLTGIGVGIFGGCCGTTPAHIEAIAKAARTAKKPRFGDVIPANEGIYVSTTRLFGMIGDDAEYVEINGDSEDDIYDITEDCDGDEVLYFELQEGAADLLIRMDAFISNPYALRGDENEIAKVEAALARKVR